MWRCVELMVIIVVLIVGGEADGVFYGIARRGVGWGVVVMIMMGAVGFWGVLWWWLLWWWWWVLQGGGAIIALHNFVGDP